MTQFTMFMNCPAFLDDTSTTRCGLPAEVKSRYTVRSTDGPLESVIIRCPLGHWFNGPVEFLAIPAGRPAGTAKSRDSSRPDSPHRRAPGHR